MGLIKTTQSTIVYVFLSGCDTSASTPVTKAQITRTQEKLMDIYDLFDGIAEAFRQYQAEMNEQEQSSSNPIPTGLEPETGVNAERSAERANRRKSLIYKDKKTDPACRTRQQDRFV